MGHAETLRRDVAIVARDLWRGGRGWILLSISAGWFLSFGVRLVYPALVPFFQSEFGMSLATAGLLLSVLWGAYAIGQLPGGILGDRIGEGNILVISTAVSGVTVLLVSASTTVWTLFGATIAFGFATALYGPTRFTVFSDIYAERSGTAIGLTLAAGSAGNALLPVAAVVLATSVSWRLGFGIAFPLFVVVALALRATVPGRTSGVTSAVDEFSLRAFRRVGSGIARGSIPGVVAAQVLVEFAFQGFAGFYPTYLVIAKGLSPAVATSLFGLFFVASFLIQPLSGIGMDRFGTRATLLALLGGIVAGLWLLPVVNGLPALIALTVLLATMSGFPVVSQTYVADTLPGDMKGTGLGALKSGWMVLGATSPVLVGFLGDSGAFDEAFFLLAGVATVGLVLTVSRL